MVVTLLNIVSPLLRIGQIKRQSCLFANKVSNYEARDWAIQSMIVWRIKFSESGLIMTTDTSFGTGDKSTMP